MSDLYAKCPHCKQVWRVAKLPLPLLEVVELASKTTCPNQCDDKPVMASEAEFTGATHG